MKIHYLTVNVYGNFVRKAVYRKGAEIKGIIKK